MKILGIDSSTKKLSMAVSSDNNLLASKTFCPDNGFLPGVIAFIESLLKKAKLNLEDMDLFCVNTGPGDFTGTRIGISIIKIFGLIYNKPVYGIDTLDIFALQALKINQKTIEENLKQGKKVIIIPVLDVKRDELFFSVYRAEKNVAQDGSKIDITRSIDNFLVYYKDISQSINEALEPGLNSADNSGEPLVFLCGTAFNSFKQLFQIIKKSCGDFMLDKKSLWPDAQFLNHSAFKLASMKIKPAENIVPFYVREFLPFGKSKKIQ